MISIRPFVYKCFGLVATFSLKNVVKIFLTMVIVRFVAVKFMAYRAHLHPHLRPSRPTPWPGCQSTARSGVASSAASARPKRLGRRVLCGEPRECCPFGVVGWLLGSLKKIVLVALKFNTSGQLKKMNQTLERKSECVCCFNHVYFVLFHIIVAKFSRCSRNSKTSTYIGGKSIEPFCCKSIAFRLSLISPSHKF